MISKVFTFFCIAANVGLSLQAQETDLTGRVYDLIADYQINYDDVHKNPYVFVGRGKRIIIDESRVDTRDLWYIGYFSNRVSFSASSITIPSSTTRYVEHWSQRLQKNDKVRMRAGPYRGADTEVFTDLDSEEYQKSQRSLSRIDPLDQVLSIAKKLDTGSHTASRMHEMLLGKGVQLAIGKYTKDGDIEAEFNISSNYPIRLTVLFGKKQRFFPISVEWETKLTKKGFFTLSHQLIDWQRRQELMVPSRIQAISTQPSGMSRNFDISFEWKLNESIPENLVEVESDVWRENIRVLFDAGWQRRETTPPVLPFGR